MRGLAVFVCMVAALGLVLTGVAEAKRATDKLFDASLTYVGKSENDSSSSDTEIQRTVLTLGGKYPIPIAKKHLLMIGLDYSGQFVSYDNFTPSTPPGFGGQQITEDDMPDSLHSIHVPVTFVATWTEQWNTVFQVSPGIQSDFEDLSDDDVITTAMVLAQYKFGKNDIVGFGAAFSDAFGSLGLLPVLKLYWYPTEQWYVEAFLPFDLDVGYVFSEQLSAGLEGKLRGYQYRLSEDQPWDNKVLRFREVRIGPFVDYAITEKAHLRASVGAVTAQKFEIRDDDNDDKLVDGDYENTYYATVNFFIPF